MSVINQMLRDLDERRAPALAPAGTVPVAPQLSQPVKKNRSVLGWALLVVVVCAAAAFVVLNPHVLFEKAAPAAATVAAAPAVPLPTVSAPVPAPALAPASASALSVSESLPAPVAQATNVEPPPALKASPTASAVPVDKFESALAMPSAPAQKASTPAAQVSPQRQRPESAPVVSVAADPAQRQMQAGREALAQAQSLWSGGSRDAGIELLQQTMEAVQRNAAGVPAASANTLLAALAREWSRMQLAEGRVGAVWETLTRLETQLRGEADLWAVRANAAQRLGRHQDSVYAYMVALESRPAEQRWLLGAAVSLAALGQTNSAAEMAEKGRLAGPISPEVQAYLRQAGVVLKDR